MNRKGALRRISAVLAPFALITLVMLAAYGNTFHSPFAFDDIANIVENPSLKITGISFTNLKDAAVKSVVKHRWLPYISLALNYYFNQMDVFGYHLVNLIIHILTAVFLYLLAYTTLGLPLFTDRFRHRREIALAAALLWAAHPVQTNAVTYIVQRMTGMAALFYLASLLFYVRGRLAANAAPRYASYAAGISAGIMAMACKEISAMLPVMILGYEFFFLSDLARRLDYKKIIPAALLGLMVVSLMVLLYLGHDPFTKILAGYEARNFTPAERLLTEPRIIFHYLGILLLPLPARLCLLYDYQVSHSLFSPPQTIMAIIGLLGLVILIMPLYKKNRLWSFALFWFLGNLVIESSIIPLELIFEHRIYLPSMFLFLAAAASIYRFCGARVKLCRATIILTVALFTCLTWQRNLVWQSRESLWSDVVAKAPALARGYINLGNILRMNGKYKEAGRVLEKALTLDRDSEKESGIAYFNLAAVYEHEGRLRDALGALDNALAMKGINLPKVHDELKEVYSQLLNKDPGAVAGVLDDIRRSPDLTNNLVTMGRAYEENGRHGEAFTLFKEAGDRGVNNAYLYCNWALTCINLAMYDRALGYLRYALRLAPDRYECHYYLGVLYRKTGREAEAQREMAAARRLRP